MTTRHATTRRGFSRTSPAAGGANDIEKATELARRMVTEWGMSDAIGPLNFGSGEHEVFLGRDFTQGETYSEETAQRIDAEIHRIVTDQHARARKLLEAQLATLHAIAGALLEVETLSGQDVDDLMSGKPIEPRRLSTHSDTGDGDGEPASKKRPGLFPPLGEKEPDPEPA